MNVVALLMGFGFGLAIAGARLTDYDVIHNMLLLRDLDPYLLMASAIGTAAPILWALRRSRWHTPYGGPLKVERLPVERKHVLGSVVFGAGWAVTGACPGVVLGVAAGGNLAALATLAGIVMGIIWRDAVVARAAERDARATVVQVVPTAAR